jgi:hypothetical protein
MPLLALLRRHLQQQLLPLLSLQYVHLTSHAKRCDLLLLSPAHTHIRSSYFRPIPNTGTNVWCEGTETRELVVLYGCMHTRSNPQAQCCVVFRHALTRLSTLYPWYISFTLYSNADNGRKRLRGCGYARAGLQSRRNEVRGGASVESGGADAAWMGSQIGRNG